MVWKIRLSIKAWAEEDRPREKLMYKGRSALTDAELIAILIGSGSRNETAVEVAKRILSSVENDIYRLSRMSLKDLQTFKGIGEAKAYQRDCCPGARSQKEGEGNGAKTSHNK